MRQRDCGEYPPDWKQIAKAIKDECNWQCVRCGHPHDPKAGYCLTVHHLDADKSNCEWYNLAALCQRCHLTVQGKVIMCRPWFLDHSEWFKPYVAGYYARVAGIDTAREFVLSNIDYLLNIGQGRIDPHGIR